MRRNRRPGFLAIPHELDDLPIFDGDFALKGIFFQLCHWANFAPGEVEFNGRRHALERGELVTSLTRLSTRSGLSKDIIRRCLARLEKEGMISWRQKNENPTVDAENPTAKPTVETVYIVNNYDGLFGTKGHKPHSEPHSGTPKTPQRTKSIPLYSLKNKNTHTDAQEGVCKSSIDDGKPADPADTIEATDEGAAKLKDLWNASVEGSGLVGVSDMPPARLDAARAAIRARNSLSWWRGVFQAAALTGPLPVSGWRPTFDFALKGINATRILEGHFPKAKPRYSHKIFNERDFPS